MFPPGQGARSTNSTWGLRWDRPVEPGDASQGVEAHGGASRPRTHFIFLLGYSASGTETLGDSSDHRAECVPTLIPSSGRLTGKESRAIDTAGHAPGGGSKRSQGGSPTAISLSARPSVDEGVAPDSVVASRPGKGFHEKFSKEASHRDSHRRSNVPRHETR